MSRCTHPFDDYVRNCGENLRVAHANLLLALDHDANVRVEDYLRRLDDLARRVDALGAVTPCERIAALRHVLVEQERLLGRPEDFCDPRASYLNQVLDRRHGLPITLSAVWLDVAGTLGWPFRGVGMPGHFLVAQHAGESDWLYLDPFDGGEVLDEAACARILAKCCGPAVALAPDHLAPVCARAILTRMLGNLKSLYCAAQRWTCAEKVLQRLLALHPEDATICEDIRRVRRMACEQN